MPKYLMRVFEVLLEITILIDKFPTHNCTNNKWNTIIITVVYPLNTSLSLSDIYNNDCIINFSTMLSVEIVWASTNISTSLENKSD